MYSECIGIVGACVLATWYLKLFKNKLKASKPMISKFICVGWIHILDIPRWKGNNNSYHQQATLGACKPCEKSFSMESRSSSLFHTNLIQLCMAPHPWERWERPTFKNFKSKSKGFKKIYFSSTKIPFAKHFNKNKCESKALCQRFLSDQV